MDLRLNCEYCNKQHDGTYGSGRFCSQQCARGFSTKAKRKEINEKVSKKAKENYINSPKQIEHLCVIRQKAIRNIHSNKDKRFVKSKNGDILDITYGELRQYRQNQLVCEICGKPEKFKSYKSKKSPNKLAADHNHSTKHFRGLLCGDCNRKLGWFENLSKEILEYLEEKDGSVA